MPTKLGMWEKKTPCGMAVPSWNLLDWGRRAGCQEPPATLLEDLRCLLGLAAFFKSVILDSEEGGDARHGKLEANPSSRAVPPQLRAPLPAGGG